MFNHLCLMLKQLPPDAHPSLPWAVLLLVASAVLAVVLVSDTASYLTGRTVFVDGGMTDYPDFARGG